jgi:hypothetical protein
MLSNAQIDHFRTFGFVPLPNFLGADRASALRHEVDTAIRDAYATTYDEQVIDGISGYYLPMASRSPRSAPRSCVTNSSSSPPPSSSWGAKCCRQSPRASCTSPTPAGTTRLPTGRIRRQARRRRILQPG